VGAVTDPDLTRERFWFLVGAVVGLALLIATFGGLPK